MFKMVPYRRYLTSPTKPFESFLSDPFFRSFMNFGESRMNGSFRVDIQEKADAFLIEAELPGLSQDQINLEVEEDMLTISADFQRENRQEEGGRLYCERQSGHMERSFNLTDIDADKISANYKNGILYVNLPKMQQEEKTARKIPVLMEDNQQDQAE